MGIAELIELEKEALRKEYELKIAKLQAEIDSSEEPAMEWLKKYLGIKTEETIKKNILFPFRKELEPDIVDFPPTNGSYWYVNKEKFKEWYAENFGRINRRPRVKEK